jgi:hypothetical protein
MKHILELDPLDARHIIHRMGESGQPPEFSALAVNVGTEEVLQILKDEYLLSIKESGRSSSFKLVQAPFGGGKSQFLHCLRELAQGEGFCTALVGVSPKECPFDDAAQIYQAVARSIELPVPEGETARPEPGITNLLSGTMERRVLEYGKEAFLDWVNNELARRTCESQSMLRGVVAFLDASARRDLTQEQLLGDYLRGELSSVSEVSRYQIRELPDGEKGFRFLRTLAQIIRFLELPGLVLLFDEMDRTMSLARKRKRAIGDNLRQMIDNCGRAVFPGVLLVYAVPPEFMTQVVIEYPALEQRLKQSLALGTASPMAPVIDLDRLPLSAFELFRRIGLNLLKLYHRGFSVDLNEPLQSGNIDMLAKTMSDDILESGSRRAFVKAAVAMLADQHHTAVRKLNSSDVSKFARTAQLDDSRLMEGEREI